MVSNVSVLPTEMTPLELSWTVPNKTERDVIEYLNKSFSDNRPVMKDTTDGYQKMVVLGWSIVIKPEPWGVVLIITPLWRHNQPKTAVNLLTVINSLLFS